MTVQSRKSPRRAALQRSSPAAVCSDSHTGCSAATDLTDSRESVGAEVVKQGGYDLRVENLTTLEFRKKRGQKTDPKTHQKVTKIKLENDVSSNKQARRGNCQPGWWKNIPASEKTKNGRFEDKFREELPRGQRAREGGLRDGVRWGPSERRKTCRHQTCCPE